MLLFSNIPREAISDGDKETGNNRKNLEDRRHSPGENRGSHNSLPSIYYISTSNIPHMHTATPSLFVHRSFPLSSNPFICVSFSLPSPFVRVFYPSITPSASHYPPQPHPIILSVQHSIFFPPFSVSHSTFLLSRSLMSTASILSLSISCTIEFIWREVYSVPNLDCERNGRASPPQGAPDSWKRQPGSRHFTQYSE